jgi:hypothetical protein
MNEINLENRRFGKLTAINKVNKKWECVCDCGGRVSTRTTSLLGGHTTSCGCNHNPNLVGNRFLRLTVLRLIGKNKNGRRVWECQCDCGKTKNVTSNDLKYSKVQSCGCKKREETITRQWRGCGKISGSLWNRIISQAKSRKLEVKVTIQDIWDLFLTQGGKCNLTGETLVFSSGNRTTDGTASLDRINSKLGYTKENIQWIHKDVNQMKMDMDEGYFIEICRKIVDKRRCQNENSFNQRRD